MEPRMLTRTTAAEIATAELGDANVDVLPFDGGWAALSAGDNGHGPVVAIVDADTGEVAHYGHADVEDAIDRWCHDHGR
jgi:hypothetical protein